ncbi:Phosphoglycolate phosphatase [compost metagenome]
MREKKIILFDLDDTLIYTFQNSYLKITYALQQMNRSRYTPTINEFIQVYGIIPFPDCMLQWIKKEDLFDFLQHYEKSKEKLPYQSICSLDLLKNFLSDHDLRCGLITNTPEDRIFQKVEQVFSREILFEFIFSNANKPDPIGILRAKQYFAVNGSEIVYIGDSLIDYATSLAANVDFIAVTTGTTKMEQFCDAGLITPRIYKSVTEILTCTYL